MLKNLIFAVLMMPLVAMAQNCPPNSNNPNCYPMSDWPGEAPDWTQRYTISCSMVNNETGAVQSEMKHGNMDYAQGGSLYVYLNNAVLDWYDDLRKIAQQAGADMRLVPDRDSPLTNLIEIEVELSEQDQ